DTWTDERLDDLNRKVDQGFADTRTEFRALRQDMRDEFTNVRGEIGSVRGELSGEIGSVRNEIGGVRAEIGEVRSELAAMNRTFLQLAWGLIGAILVGFLSTAAAIVTQL
ncbi:MAG: hypothetical protein JST31_07075, partial [Actinobacteria bacterium]|nr:hypothetical protein [Actinomycetota bacterium]